MFFFKILSQILMKSFILIFRLIMSAEGDVNPKAYPLADAKLTKDILELVHQAQNYVNSQILFNLITNIFLFSDNYAKVLMKQLKHSIVVNQN
jgi:hypothetical protein